MSEDYVSLPLWAAIVLAGRSWPRCGVCWGTSPASDGHDMNPPCIGAAFQAVRDALRASDQSEGLSSRSGLPVVQSEPRPASRVRPGVCAKCGHPETQHDDGGCLSPKWDKSGGTTCYCPWFIPLSTGGSDQQRPL